MRLSRPCYDKPRRCPGWAGGGTTYANLTRCNNGTIVNAYEGRFAQWLPHRCNRCDVIVLPYAVRWLDPGWWRWEIAAWRRERE